MNWFKNLRPYRLSTEFKLSAQDLADLLAKHQFSPCGSQEPLSMGWVARVKAASWCMK